MTVEYLSNSIVKLSLPTDDGYTKKNNTIIGFWKNTDNTDEGLSTWKGKEDRQWVISWTTESISTMVNYTLWVCCNQPRAHPDLRVKYQTFQTKFLCKTINTARFLKASAFFTAIICPFWFKTSKVMTLLTFCISNYRPLCVKALFSLCNWRYELSICM